jgi:hypothetical protein
VPDAVRTAARSETDCRDHLGVSGSHRYLDKLLSVRPGAIAASLSARPATNATPAQRLMMSLMPPYVE